MAKRIFVIHGWEGDPKNGWYPWLKTNLEKKEFTVFVPEMPNTYHPQMDEWLEHLKKIVVQPDENCYFIGHSLGCITILRYLESLKENQRIGGAIFFAGFTDDLGYKELSNFFVKTIQWDKIRPHCRKFIAIHSDNDPYVSLKYGDIFKKKLNADVIVQHNMKHFSADDGITELPIALDSILKISK